MRRTLTRALREALFHSHCAAGTALHKSPRHRSCATAEEGTRSRVGGLVGDLRFIYRRNRRERDTSKGLPGCLVALTWLSVSVAPMWQVRSLLGLVAATTETQSKPA